MTSTSSQPETAPETQTPEPVVAAIQAPEPEEVVAQPEAAAAEAVAEEVSAEPTAGIPAEIDPAAVEAAKPAKRGRKKKEPVIEAEPASGEPASDATPADEATPAPRKRGRPAKAKAETAASEAPGQAPALAELPADASPLQQALHAAITAKGLGLPAAAAAIGVALPGLRRVLAGESRPNARTMSSYAGWLGIEAASLVPAKAKAPKAPRGRRPAAAGTPAAKPDLDVKAAFRTLRDLIAAAGAEPEAIEAEIDPELEALRDDELAWAVHQAPAATRRVIAAALSSLARR